MKKAGTGTQNLKKVKGYRETKLNILDIIRHLEGIDKAPPTLFQDQNVDTIIVQVFHGKEEEPVERAEIELPRAIRMYPPFQIITDAVRDPERGIVLRARILLFNLGLKAMLHPTKGYEAHIISHIMGKKFVEEFKDIPCWCKPRRKMVRYTIELWKYQGRIRTTDVVLATHLIIHDLEELFKYTGGKNIVLSRLLGGDKGSIWILLHTSMLDALKKYRRIGAYVCRYGYLIALCSREALLYKTPDGQSILYCPNTECPLRKVGKCDENDWCYMLSWYDTYYEDLRFRPVIHYSITFDESNIKRIAGNVHNPLVLEIIKNLEFRGAVTGVQIELRNENLALPILWTFSTIGYRYISANAISIALDKEWLKKVVSAALLKDIQLFKIMLLKYFIEGYNRSKHLFKEKRGYFNTYRLAELILYLATGDKDYEERYPKFKELRKWLQNADDIFRENTLIGRCEPHGFVEWATKVAQHTLGHLLFTAIVEATLHADEDNFTLICEEETIKSKIRDNKYRILIVEDSEGGMGYVETLEKLSKSDHNFLYSILQRALRQLETRYAKDPCIEGWHQYRTRIQQNLPKLVQEAQPLIQRLRQLNTNFKQIVGIDIPYEIARNLINMDRILKEILKKIRDKLKQELEKQGMSKAEIKRTIDDTLKKLTEIAIIVTLPYDWDGCLGCIRFEYTCQYTAYEQMFNLSKRLAKSILEALTDTTPIHTFSGKRAGQELKKALQRAKREIKIVSPWISASEARQLLEMASRGIKIKIITRERDPEVRTHNEAIQLLQHVAKNKSNIKLFFVHSDVSNKLHSKLYIVDDVVAMSGSINLTRRGLEENIEHLVISSNKNMVLQMIGDYLEHKKIAIESIRDNS